LPKWHTQSPGSPFQTQVATASKGKTHGRIHIMTVL